MIDVLESALDARGIPWDLYKAMQGGWIIRLGDKVNERSVSGTTLSEALRAAIVEPVPVIVENRPRVPTGLRVEKNGSKWMVVGDSGSYMHNLPTKTAALEAVTKIETRSAEWMADWQANEEPKCRGQYGIDWVWKNEQHERWHAGA